MDHARGARGDSRIAGEGEGVGEGLNVWQRKRTRMNSFSGSTTPSSSVRDLFGVPGLLVTSVPANQARSRTEEPGQFIPCSFLATHPLPLNLGTET